MSSSNSATESRAKRAEEQKEKRLRTRELFNAPSVKRVKDKAQAEQKERTVAAVEDCKVNRLYANTKIVAIDVSPAAGTWSLHQRQGFITLSRGVGEILTINQLPGSTNEWVVDYDEPVEQNEDGQYVSTFEAEERLIESRSQNAREGSRQMEESEGASSIETSAGTRGPE
jgi:hypothetical protein